jgi:hypothetical protein
MRRLTHLTLLTSGLLLAAGCASEGEPGAPDLCAQATDHLAACLDQEAGQAPAACDEAQANQILSTDCGAFEAQPGKADAWWCTPWTPIWVAGCGGGLTPTPTPGADDELEAGICGKDGAVSLNPVLVKGRVDFAYDSLGSQISSIACARVALRDELGNIVATAHTITGGTFSLRGAVKDGTYDLIVFDRYGEDDDNIALEYTKEPALRQVEIGAGVPVEDFTLSSYRNGESGDFGFISDSERISDAVSRCADVTFQFTVVDACGEPLAPYYDIRRDWAITLANVDTGEVEYATPLCQPISGDHWSWDGCNGGEDDTPYNSFRFVLPGSYEVRFFRVDLPDRNNIDTGAELCSRRYTEDPEVITFSFDAPDEGGVIDLAALLGESIKVTDPTADDCR